MFITLIVFYIIGFGIEHSQNELEGDLKKNIVLVNVIALIGLFIVLIFFIPPLYEIFLQFSLVFVILLGTMMIIYPISKILSKEVKNETKRKLLDSMNYTNLFFFSFLLVVFMFMTLFNPTFVYHFMVVSIYLMSSIAVILYGQEDYKTNLKYFFILFGSYAVFLIVFNIFGSIFSYQGQMAEALTSIGLIFTTILSDPIVALASVMILLGAIVRTREGSTFLFVGNVLLIFVPLLFWMMIFLGYIQVPPQLVTIFLNVQFFGWLLYTVFTGLIFIVLISTSTLISNIVLD
jgi:hypothetical protein